MKYGTALHVALSHEDFKVAKRVFKMLMEVPDFQGSQDLNKVDEDGNTPLHVLMRNFVNDP
jgi:ankyrin repeat protein